MVFRNIWNILFANFVPIYDILELLVVIFVSLMLCRNDNAEYKFKI